MRAVRAFIVLATAGCLAGCNQAPGSRVLAKVNGIAITTEDLSYQPPQAHGGPGPEYGKKDLGDVINEELLCQKGMQLGLDDDPGYRAQAARLARMPAEAKRLEMARRVFNTEIAGKVNVTFRDGKEYFDRHKEEIATELHLEMLKFSSRSQAEAALKRLGQGATVAAVAREMKQVPQNQHPWDLGYVSWSDVPIDFAQQIYRLKPGGVSGILGNHRTGFQIVKLLARRSNPGIDYPGVSATVVNRLRDLRLLQGFEQYVAGLRKEAKILTF